MKSKKLITTAALLVVASQASVVSLAASNGNTSDGKLATNQVDIEFLDNTDPTKPVDPEHPDKPVTPENPDEETHNKGPLSIDLVSNYNFGQIKISGNENTYYAKPTTVTQEGTTEKVQRANYVQVTDNRGSGSGWKVMVSQPTALKHKTINTNTIEKTTISLLNGVSNSVNKTATNTPTPAAEVKITPGAAAVRVVTAEKNQGIGTWTHAFGKDATEGAKSVSLDIAGDQKISKGAYSTTLNWELVDDPS
ncbi:WxL domain-containing protein [Vagococcus sp. JNUCC 83]